MKEAVITTRRKDLDNFEGQSKGSTVWFNIDHEFKKKIYFLHLNQTSIIFYEKDIEGLDMEPYQKFL